MRWHDPQTPELLEAKHPCPQCNAVLLVPAVGATLTCQTCQTPLLIQREGGLRLEPVGTLDSPLAQSDDADVLRTMTALTQAVGWGGIALTILFLLFGANLFSPSIIILLGLASISLAAHYVLLKPWLMQKSRETLKQMASQMGLSKRFMEAVQKKRVDTGAPRGKQILALYRAAGEEAALAVVNKEVMIGMTEGMVRLAWGQPSKILGKRKGGLDWTLTNPQKAAQNRWRMLWVYKSGVKKKVWFKKGRVFRVQRGTTYINHSIQTP
ncbi:MAG: hypothetical protein ACLFTK_10005 [Anaerolineales bacterium]